MHLRVAAPGSDLTEADVDRIERDLEKIDRRLPDKEVYAEIRLGGDPGGVRQLVTLSVEYGPVHLVAKAQHEDIGQAVRQARDEILRQINDRSPGGHSSFAKGR